MLFYSLTNNNMYKQLHKTIMGCLLFLPLLLFFGCSESPEEVGNKLAERKNENYRQYLMEHQQAEAEFVKDFNASNYATRDDALMDYDKRLTDLIIAYQNRKREIDNECSEASIKYIKNKNTDDWYKYNEAFENGIDQQLQARIEETMGSTEYPAAVLNAIRTIIPVKPDTEKIIEDLQSEKISEGFPRERCWFSEDQRWTLARYDIKDFKIEEVLQDNDKDYIFIATMRMENDHNAFDARVKISYQLPSDEDWKMEFVNSLGLSIVRTHKYDDLVSFEIADDGWGGVNSLQISNRSNVDLVVGVDYVTRGTRRRSTVQVSPDRKAQVGGTFGGGSVTSYEIGFIERL